MADLDNTINWMKFSGCRVDNVGQEFPDEAICAPETPSIVDVSLASIDAAMWQKPNR
jgi:hypothetical protein